MALVSVKLTKNGLDESRISIEDCILPYNPTQEVSVRTIVRNFLKKHEDDKINVFVSQEKDHLANLVILKQECQKNEIELKISLYCENTNLHDEDFGKMYFREVDLNLSKEFEEMLVW